VYQRTAVLFQTIANVYGAELLEQALRSYATRHRFQHPTPDDLLAALGEALPAGALDNLRAALYQGHGVDYRVSTVESAPALRLPTATGPREQESRVIVSRHGDLQFPVDVLLTLQNGSQLRERWDGTGSFHVFTQRGPSPVVSAMIDPEQRILLDDNLLNNTRQSRTADGASTPLGLFARFAELWQWLGAALRP
jgi:hypothetical protein